MVKSQVVAVIGTALAVVFAAMPASADSVQLRDSDAYAGYFVPGTAEASLRATTNGGGFRRFHTGTFGLETDFGGGWQPLTTYCVEPTQTLKFGTQPGDTIGLPYTYTAIEDYAPITAAEASFLGVLWANAFGDSTDNPVNAAAFQAIVWETAVDDTFDLVGGDFQVSSSYAFSLEVLETANGWAANVNDQTWTSGANLAVLAHPSSQDYLMMPNVPTTTSIPAVPTPSAWALGSVGLAFLGLRRRIGATAGRVLRFLT